MQFPSRLLPCTCILSLVLTAACAAPTSEGEVVTESAAFSVRDVDASRCELYVDEFLTRSTGSRGSSYRELVANLRVAPGLDVVGAGAYFFFREDSQVFRQEPGGTRSVVSSINADVGEFVNGVRKNNGLYEVAFRNQWQEYGDREGTRAVRNFAYFVDVQSGTERTRIWLKNGVTDFTAQDISKDRYFYSEGIFLGGYSGGSYLWRDSGSPIFAKRNACL